MGKLVALFLGLSVGAAMAQTAQNESLKGQPIEITSSGGTEYRNGIATARQNVAIHAGTTDIYGDYAVYNSETHMVDIQGNVRIYRATELYVGDTGSYNTETQEITADNLRSLENPYFLAGEHVDRMKDEAKDDETLTLVKQGYFTTDDAFTPDFRMKASTVRVYENDYVVFKNLVFYIGKVPVFYFPYLYQSLDDAFSFMISPAYTSSWGASLLSRLSFPIGKHIKATARLDYRARRGIAGGLILDGRYGAHNESWAKLHTYFAQDENPLINRTSLPRGAVPTSRYRLTLDNRTEFGHDITGDVHVTRLSDPYLLEDFFQNEFRVNPEPDNWVGLQKWNPNYTLTAYSRFQMNDFFETTERLPEVALDIKRQPLFGTGIFYEGEASLSNLSHNFPKGSIFQDYETLRLDTFHQLSYPQKFFGWLSFVPRVGFRATYYERTRDLENAIFANSPDPLTPEFTVLPATTLNPLVYGDDLVRTVFNTGFEASFKLSRTWEGAQSRFFGLDGLRHIMQPFVNFSYVTGNNVDPERILQFDRYVPSTQLPPIDFPQFSSIDTIADWTIARVGVRQRLQTRRDDATINWMELLTFLNVNIDNPFDRKDTSNLQNYFNFQPLPWFGVGVGAQIPLEASGFTEVNTDVHIQPISNVNLYVGHRYLQDAPFFFPDSSLFTFGGYWRVNDNWGVGVYERYEAETGFMEEQRYTLHRDLSSWVASLSGVIRNNGGVKEYGVILTFTLKALPKMAFDFNYDPGGTNDPAH